jgi:hypothetical protein
MVDEFITRHLSRVVLNDYCLFVIVFPKYFFVIIREPVIRKPQFKETCQPVDKEKHHTGILIELGFKFI